MKNKHTTPFLFLFVMALFRPCSSRAWENYLPGGRSLALAHASVSFSDTWSVFHNQAGMTGLQTFSAGFFFESRFGLDELSLAAVSAVLPSASGAFGLSLLQFGQSVFKENKFGLAYARQLAKNWSAGIQLDCLCRSLPGSSRTQKLATFEGGVLFQPDEKLHLGAHIFNPMAESFGNPSANVKTPAVCRAGGHYCFDETVRLVVEIMKESHQNPTFKTGIEFLPAKTLNLRIGAAGKPFNYTAGIGYHTGRLTADIAFSCHATLGITPSVSVQIQPF